MTSTNSADRAHAKLSASGSKQWGNCPGSIPLSEGLPNESSDFAALGTAAHALGERCLKEDFADPDLYLGWHIDRADKFYQPGQEAPDDAFLVDDDMTEAVRVYVEYVQQEVEKLPSGELAVEKSFDLSWVRPDMFGTNDACIYEFMGWLVVIDYKHGQGVPVEVEENGKGNSQLLYYALGAAKERDFLAERVKIVVVQPRCPHPKGGVREFEMSMEDLQVWGEQLGEKADVVREAEESFPGADKLTAKWVNKYLNPGEDQCRWCLSSGGDRCPAIGEKALTVAQADFADDPFELEVPTDLEAIAHALEWTGMIDIWVKAVKANAQKLAEGGHKIPGYKLVKGKTNAKWREDLHIIQDEGGKNEETFTGEEALLYKLQEDFGIDRDEAFTDPQPVLLSIAQLEKAHIKGKGSGALKKKLRDELTFKPEGKLALAPESDARTEIPAPAKLDFEGIDD